MGDRMTAAIEKAVKRGEAVLRQEPRAKSARYDRKTGRIIIDLTNGCTFAFPAKDAQGLEGVDEAALAGIEILGLGTGLHWKKLDVDLSVPGLLAGLLGTKAWMNRQRAAKAGSARSPGKAAAARENGKKGGRPPKVKLSAGKTGILPSRSKSGATVSKHARKG